MTLAQRAAFLLVLALPIVARSQVCNPTALASCVSGGASVPGQPQTPGGPELPCELIFGRCASGSVCLGVGANRQCTNLNINPLNCGQPNNACIGNSVCCSGNCCGGSANPNMGCCSSTGLGRTNTGVAVPTCVARLPGGELSGEADNPWNCGTCGNVCPPGPTNSMPACANKECTFNCDVGYTRCNAACANTAADPQNCGTCGHACPITANASAACSAQGCSFTCDSGFIRAGNACFATVWGFADLHTHPGSHLAFGSDGNGENGLFWGKPADPNNLDVNNYISATLQEVDPTNDVDPNSAYFATDLPQCGKSSTYGLTHNATSFTDFVKNIADNTILTKLDATAPQGFNRFNHDQPGFPSFSSWPHALSVDHQEMHITAIRRAFQGGLRLMFASVTNDELLHKLWQLGFNASGNSMPAHEIDFDFRSAKKQLQYITDLVNANWSWMGIVRSPSEARQAITAHKLAVVLSLEMDSLSLAQIQSLVQQFGVAHVVPVHLVDNTFGGTALYQDEFNNLNNWINGSFYSAQTQPDPNVTFSLGVPSVLTANTVSSVTGWDTGSADAAAALSITLAAIGPFGWLADGILGAVGAIFGAANNAPTGTFGYAPAPISSDAFAQLKYPSVGDVNSKHLNAPLFEQLMEMGLLLDVAHMGELTSLDALNLAATYKYPLMDSHTGVRCDDPTGKQCRVQFSSSEESFGGSPSWPGSDERSLPVSQLKMIRDLGGVIGLGEVPGLTDPDPMSTWIQQYGIVLLLMGGKGVALGTDANGLSPLIQGDTLATVYPISVGRTYGDPAGFNALNRYQVGTRQPYDFHVDGIATYALLPDFVQAADAHAATRSGRDPNIRVAALFHSAEDVIEMWEKVEQVVFVTTASLPFGEPLNVTGLPYMATLSARGGTPPYTWSVVGGSLPPGLNLSSEGTISGRQSVNGIFEFTVMVKDSLIPTPSVAARQLSIVWAP
jgi:microsomal dipeptidase-like Zn-dependent dipeptidase